MKTTRVAAVSMNGFLGVPEQVLPAIDAWCERAAAEKAELVLFPELVIHGHCTPTLGASSALVRPRTAPHIPMRSPTCPGIRCPPRKG